MHALQQAAQDLPTRRVHVERQRDRVIDDDMSWKIPLADACLTARRHNFLNLADGKRLGDDAQADEIRDPAPRRKFRRCACHRSSPLIR